MIIDILTLFPQPVESVLCSSILRRAQVRSELTLKTTDLRRFATDAYKSVDDTPFGGGPGMLFRADILDAALCEQLDFVGGDRSRLLVVYPSPRGLVLEQNFVQTLAGWLVGGAAHGQDTPDPEIVSGVGDRPGDSTQNAERRICIIAGRYEGIDERVVDKWVDLEVSLGDIVLTGGEIPALALVDAIVRWIPGVLGHSQSAIAESFAKGLLEYPQYTKPRDLEFLGYGEVPPELLTGNHQLIADFQLKASLLLTFAYRPDLIRKHSGQGLPVWARELLDLLKRRCDLRGMLEFTTTSPKPLTPEG